MLADVDQYLEEMVKSGPLANLTQKVSEAEDVAAVIRFLCLPDSRQMTGQVLHTSAGLVV
jgi:NAD(P)-dependent dehydrogenase (short-subunit alcohol dehydrogenase family)